MDLFQPIVEVARFHQHFRALLDPAREPDRREFLRWADGFPDRDGKLVSEFQITFNSVFWEVYLFAAFKAYGFSFNWEHRSPDFSISNGLHDLVVEAVTANAAQGKPNEWDKTYKDFHEFDIDRLNKEGMVRLSNSILSKYRKYERDYAGLAHVKRRPFILAVGPFEQPFFNHQYNRPIRAVLYDHYVDEPAYTANPEKYPNGPPDVSLGYVSKENGSEIELGLFTDDRMRHISAVLFSCTATWGKVNALTPESENRHVLIESSWGSEPDGKPVRRVGSPSEIGETITDGIQIYHNPYAVNPLDPAVFRRGGVVQQYFDKARDEWVQEEINRSLFFRLTHNVIGVENHADDVPKDA
jgi:hypothetical protein